jgi:hypothetical protein
VLEKEASCLEPRSATLIPKILGPDPYQLVYQFKLAQISTSLDNTSKFNAV